MSSLTNDIINFADCSNLYNSFVFVALFLSLVSFTKKVIISEFSAMLFPEIHYLYPNDLMDLVAFFNIKRFTFLIINLNGILLLRSGDIQSNSGPKKSFNIFPITTHLQYVYQNPFLNHQLKQIILKLIPQVTISFVVFILQIRLKEALFVYFI